MSDARRLVASILSNDANAAASFTKLFVQRPATDESRRAVLHVLAQAPVPVLASLRVRAPHFWIDALPALLAAASRVELDDFVADLLGQLARWSYAACCASDAAQAGALGVAVAERAGEAIARRLAESTHDARWLSRTEPLAEGLVLAAPGPALDRACRALVASAEPRLVARALIASARHGAPVGEEDVAVVMRSPSALWTLVAWLHTLGALERLPASAQALERRIEAQAADWLSLEEGAAPHEIVCVETRMLARGDEPLHVGLCRYSMEPGQAPRLVFGEPGPETHGLAGHAGDDATQRALAWERLTTYHGLRAT